MEKEEHIFFYWDKPILIDHLVRHPSRYGESKLQKWYSLMQQNNLMRNFIAQSWRKTNIQ